MIYWCLQTSHAADHPQCARFLSILNRTAVPFNQNDTFWLFTYELYMAHILHHSVQVLRKAQHSRTASCCICLSVCLVST